MGVISNKNAEYKAIGFRRWFAWVLLGIISAGMVLYVVFRMFVFTLKSDLTPYEWKATDTFNSANYSTVTADVNGNFTILQLTDLHFLSGTGSLDLKTLDLAERLIDKTNPDLVVVTGDTTFAIDNANALKKWIKFIDKQCAKRGIKWAMTFGNHDSTGFADKTRLCDMLQKSEYSLFDAGPTNLDDGLYGKTLGNYAINLKNAAGEIKGSFILLDSNEAGKDKQEGKYAPISKSTVSWYEWYLTGIKNEIGFMPPSLAFFHIPLPEYAIATQNFTESDGKFEKVCCSGKNTGMFAKIKELGSTVATFSGHDHQNHYQVNYEGILLANTISGGYCTYGKKAIKGGRVINLNVNEVGLGLDTYILFAADC